MLTRMCVFCAAVAALLLTTAPLRAQISGPAPVLYRLDAGSQFHRGCYPPCECPLFSTSNLRGTYTLTYDHGDPLFTWYNVGNVNWTVTINDADVRVTGSGQYRVGGEVAVQQQMTLTLTIGDEPPQVFDSGLVGGAAFPAINIAISQNGMYCYDTVFDLRSSPVPASERTTYKLTNSTFVQGCFPPCLCPIQSFTVTGKCELVPLPNASTPIRDEWAVVNVSWKATSAEVPVSHNFTGFGSYAIVQVGPSAQNQMVLDLSEDGGAPERYNSGLVAGGTQFPDIDIDLSINGFYCNDKAFYLHLRP